MKYLVPYSVLHREMTSAGMDAERADAIIRRMLPAVQFDEHWYLSKYPDVGEAISTGRIKSAKTHFVSDGYREGRLPFEHEIDEDWYRTNYPDIAEGVETGEISSPRLHYINYGYKEGRLPGAL